MSIIKSIILFTVMFLFTPACSDAGWQFVTPMPHARYGHDATLGTDGKIYVMGGFVWYKHNGRSSNLVYDRVKDTWKYLEPIPGWINYDRFMIFDPDTGICRTIRNIKGKENYYEVYDNLKQIWKPLPDPIPPEKIRKTNVDRTGDGCAIVTGKDGKIYLLGGKGKSPFGPGEDIVFPYDPVKKKWHESELWRDQENSMAFYEVTKHNTGIAPMLERRIDHEAVVTSDGKIYVFGGRNIGKEDDKTGYTTKSRHYVLNTVECYNPSTNEWEYRKPMTVKRFLFAAVVGPNDIIYVFGGMGEFLPDGSNIFFQTTEAYDPAKDTWKTLKPMPEPRAGIDGVLGADGKIYILGGGSKHRGPPLKSVYIYDPLKDTWEKGPDMNLPRDSLAAVATPDGKIYAIGGTDVGAYKNKEQINFFLPKKSELYTGKVQNTVEMLDIFKK